MIYRIDSQVFSCSFRIEEALIMAKLDRIVSFLDKTLDIESFSDSSNNGLQVQNSGTVRKICAGVDASFEFFEEAAERGADLLVCHHGISWNDSLRCITGGNYRKLKYLLDHDMALYACHLPLDAHPRLGNNVLICKALGLRGLRPFGEYHGRRIGFMGSFPTSIEYTDFKKKAGVVFGRLAATMDYGKATVRKVAVVSGAAGDLIAEAGASGADVYVSGEPGLAVYNLARELGVNAVFGGHYATEIFGVRAVAGLIAKRFGIKSGVINLDIPF